MPYAQAQELFQDLVGIQVSKATARRATLSTGEAALTLDEAEVERLKQEVPQAPEGADKQQLSADGVMVHLVGGEWVARQDAHHGGGDLQETRGGLHAADFHLFAAGGCRALYASLPGRNASARTGTGSSGVRRARWRGGAAGARGLPPCGCRAPFGLCRCRRIHQCERPTRPASRGEESSPLARRRPCPA